MQLLAKRTSPGAEAKTLVEHTTDVVDAFHALFGTLVPPPGSGHHGSSFSGLRQRIIGHISIRLFWQRACFMTGAKPMAIGRKCYVEREMANYFATSI